MAKPVLNRLALLVGTLLLVSILAFAAFSIIPGDPTDRILGAEATEEQIAALRARLGLDLPVWQRYISWLSAFVTGDFGDSYLYSMPVAELLASRVGVTFTLAGLAFGLIVVISIPLGIIAARFEGGIIDRGLTALTQLTMSIPNFVVGIGLYYIFSLVLKWFAPEYIRPEQGLGAHLWFMLFPALAAALAVLAVGFAAGLTIGALCGYYGGGLDALVMRLCDTVAAFPSILLALVVLAVIGPGKYNVIGALGVLFVPSFARLTRGEFLRQRDRDYVKSAKLMGVSDLRIIFVHILPNTWPVLLSGLTIGFNNAVLAEASMSYLGIGVTPQDPSLGYMLSDAQGYLLTSPWYTGFLALTVILLILGVGMTGEGIRGKMGVAA